MNENLTEEEKSLLIICLKSHAPELLKQIDRLFLKQLDHKTVNEMRSAVGEEFSSKGYERNSGANEYGWKLENLIDKLADLYIWPDRKKK
jgi:hypothetical protein